MQSLKTLCAALTTPHAPTEQWPQHTCSSGDIRIDEQGTWYYQGSVITRIGLVKLFASVLHFHQGEYLLTTPAEQCKVAVADVPFIIVSWRTEQTDEGEVLICKDNLAREWPVAESCSLFMADYKGQSVPYLHLSYGLTARVSRAVFYQWAEIAEQDTRGVYLNSAGERYYLDE